MELWQQQALFVQDIGKLLQFIYESGYYITFAEAYRPPELAVLYAKEGKGISHSLHTVRLAIDLNLFDKTGIWLTDISHWEPIGKYWESLDKQNRWGGRFQHLVDCNHFERQPK